MSSVQGFKDFICERLTAAAVEIFSAFEQTVAQYESEISRQRKLLDNNWTSQAEVPRSGIAQKNVCEDVQALSKEQLSNEKGCNVNLDKEEFACIKEEPDDQSSVQEEDQLSMNLESDNDPSIHPSSIPHEGHGAESDTFMETPSDKEHHVNEQELNTDPLLFHNSPAADDQNQEERNHLDSISSTGAAITSKRRSCRKVIGIAPVSESPGEIKPQKKVRRWNVNGKARPRNPKRRQRGRMHTDEKPCCCEACGKGFRDNYTLSVHMRTHTGEKPYACNTCGKCYRNKHGLVNHMRSHTGEKPYVCKTCGMCYKHSSGLSYHMRKHTSGEKKFSCKICGEKFRQNSELLVHVSAHTGKNLYNCNDCGKSFSLSRDLLAHMKTHSGEKRYSCQQCHKSFKLSRYLIMHMRTHR